MQPPLQVPRGESGGGSGGWTGRGFRSLSYPTFLQFPPLNSPLTLIPPSDLERRVWGGTPKSTQNLCEGFRAYLWLCQRDARLYLSNRRQRGVWGVGVGVGGGGQEADSAL